MARDSVGRPLNVDNVRAARQNVAKGMMATMGGEKAAPGPKKDKDPTVGLLDKVHKELSKTNKDVKNEQKLTKVATDYFKLATSKGTLPADKEIIKLLGGIEKHVAMQSRAQLRTARAPGGAAAGGLAGLNEEVLSGKSFETRIGIAGVNFANLVAKGAAALAGGFILGKIFDPRGQIEFLRNIREVAFVTEAVGGGTVAIQEEWQDIGKTARVTGKNVLVFQKQFLKNLKSGFKTRKETLSLTKTGLHVAELTGATSDDIADTINKWHLQMSLTTTGAAMLGRELQSAARYSNLTGDALAQAAKNAETMVTKLRDAGIFTAQAAANLTAATAEAVKLGVEKPVQGIQKALMGGREFIKETSPAMQTFLADSLRMGGYMGDAGIALRTGILDSKKEMDTMAKGMEKMFIQEVEMRTGETDLTSIEDAMNAINRANETMPGIRHEMQEFVSYMTAGEVELGNFGKTVEALRAGARTFTKNVADLEKQLVGAGPIKRQKIEQEMLDLQLKERLNLLTMVSEQANKTKDLGKGFAELSKPEFVESLRTMGVQGMSDAATARTLLEKSFANINRDIKKTGANIDLLDPAMIKDALAEGPKGLENLMGLMNESQQAVAMEQKKSTDPISQVEHWTNQINEAVREFYSGFISWAWRVFGPIGLTAMTAVGILAQLSFLNAQMSGSMLGGAPPWFQKGMSSLGDKFKGGFQKLFGKKAVAPMMAGATARPAVPGLVQTGFAKANVLVQKGLDKTGAGLKAFGKNLKWLKQNPMEAADLGLKKLGGGFKLLRQSAATAWGMLKQGATTAMGSVLDFGKTMFKSPKAAFGMVKGGVLKLGSMLSGGLAPAMSSAGGAISSLVAATGPAAPIAAAAAVAVAGFVGAMRAGAKAAEIFGVAQEKLTYAQKLSAESAGFLTGTLNFLTFGIFSKYFGPTGTATVALSKFMNAFPPLMLAIQWILLPFKILWGTLKGIWKFLKNTFIGLWDGLKLAFEPFVKLFNSIKKSLSSVFGEGTGTFSIVNMIAGAFGFLGKVLGGVFRVIGGLIGMALKPLVAIFKVLLWILTPVIETIKFVVDAFASFSNFIAGLFSVWPLSWFFGEPEEEEKEALPSSKAEEEYYNNATKKGSIYVHDAATEEATQDATSATEKAGLEQEEGITAMQKDLLNMLSPIGSFFGFGLGDIIGGLFGEAGEEEKGDPATAAAEKASEEMATQTEATEEGLSTLEKVLLTMLSPLGGLFGFGLGDIIGGLFEEKPTNLAAEAAQQEFHKSATQKGINVKDEESKEGLKDVTSATEEAGIEQKGGLEKLLSSFNAFPGLLGGVFDNLATEALAETEETPTGIAGGIFGAIAGLAGGAVEPAAMTDVHEKMQRKAAEEEPAKSIVGGGDLSALTVEQQKSNAIASDIREILSQILAGAGGTNVTGQGPPIRPGQTETNSSPARSGLNAGWPGTFDGSSNNAVVNTGGETGQG
jgi:hypothetical protein